MTFLNATALFASTGLLVPIIIHLHRKRKAQVVEWPAMQFLTQTVASRRRGLALEHLLLLFVRCLVVLLFVLAMAQPLLPSEGALHPVVPFVLITGALWGFTVAVVRSLSFRTRVTGLVAGIVLLAGAAATFTLDAEDVSSPATCCDLVIVIDETSSMQLETQQSDTRQDQTKSRFAAAIDEAQLMIDQLSGSSTVSVIRCGPVIETMEGSPFRDFPAVQKLLTEWRPVGGGASTSEAIDQAVELVKNGPNLLKQVVLLTDDQLTTWESLEQSRSLQASAGKSEHVEIPGQASTGEEQNDSRIHLAVHLAKLPRQIANVSVVGTTVEAAVPVAGQQLVIEAEVRNHGAAAVADVDVQLSVDGKLVTFETIDALPPATTTTIRFPHEFESPGDYVVTTQAEFPDAMPDDNRYDTVVSVAPYISVLLVNGNDFAEPGDQSAPFLQLSLDSIGHTDVDADETVAGRPIRVESTIAPDLPEADSLSNYDVIILSEVPQLPDQVARRLSTYVEDGGGLWVIPDQRANTTFYNEWQLVDSMTSLMPARLLDYRRTDLQDAGHPATRTSIDLQAIASGFVSDLVETGQHDLTEIVVSGYRQVAQMDSAVAEMKLTNGDPLFVDHSVGQGRVLLQTVALGQQECNLPRRVCFPVLMHLWSYFLADCQRDSFDFQPAPEISVPVLFEDYPGTQVDSLLLTDPAGEKRGVNVVRPSQDNLAQIRPAGRPGIYRLSPHDTPEFSQPFTVARDRKESDLAAISTDKLDAIQSTYGIQWLADASELRIASVAEPAEYEIAPILLLAVLCFVAMESLLAAWIRRRRSGTATTSATTSATSPAERRSQTAPLREVPGVRLFDARTSVSQSRMTQPIIERAAGSPATTPVAIPARGAE